MHRRAFTVLEVMLALAMSALIVSSALALFFALSSSDRRLASSFQDNSDLSIAQHVVRRAMGSLLASKPADPNPTRADDKSDPNEETLPEDEDGEAAEADPTASLADLITSVTGDEALAKELTSGVGAERPNFELFWDGSGPLAQQMLEVKIMESPVATTTGLDPVIEQFLPVRGVFETLVVQDRLWFQWRPIDPPGAPTVLMRDLVAVEWFVLPRSRHGKEWTDVYAAYLQEYYPVAVRLVMWTANGTYADWLFDTAVTTPETP